MKELQALGISPDVLLCRTDRYLPRSVKAKIALFCNVDEDAVIDGETSQHIYEVPLAVPRRGPRREDHARARHLDRARPTPRRLGAGGAGGPNPERTVRIAMVGKYVDLTDSYKSLNEALHHGGIAHDTRVEIEYFDSEKLDDADALAARARHPGAARLRPARRRGQDRGGALRARAHASRSSASASACRCAVIEFARDVAGLERANSAEVDPETPHPVIDLMPEQRAVAEKGATMRLGAYPCALRAGTQAAEAYGGREISERHRHRYEFNPEYRDRLSRAGLVLSGTSPDGRLIEIVELADHPWFLGCQFHPEFKSTPFAPHPLFTAFVGAAVQQAERTKPKA